MARVRIRPEWKRQVPVVAVLSTYRDWKVEMNDASDPVFTFSLRFRTLRGANDTSYPSIMDKTEVDAFEVREALFAVRTPKDALKFFRRYGPWRVNGELWAKHADPVFFSQLIDHLRGWQETLVNKDKNDNLSFNAEFRERQQIWLVACQDVQACVRTTVILDRASRWRWCARKDCTAAPFECGNHGRKYHENCGWLERKRNQRKKKRGNSDGSV